MGLSTTPARLTNASNTSYAPAGTVLGAGLVNDVGGVLNNGTVIGQGEATAGSLTNTGTLTNAGQLNNNAGTLTNAATGTLNVVVGGALENGYVYSGTCHGLLGPYDCSYSNAATLENDGTINDAGYVHNQQGTFDNQGTLSITSGGGLDNDAGATLNNYGQFANAGGVNNFGTLNNSGTFTGSGGITNDGTISNSGSFTVSDYLNGNGTFQTTGTTTIAGNFSQGDLQIGAGSFAPNAGVTVTLTSLEVGSQTNQSATYQLSGSVLSATTETLGVGSASTYCNGGGPFFCNSFGLVPGASGTLSQSSGSNTVGTLILAANPGTTGTYQLSGTGSLQATNEIIGESGGASYDACTFGCSVNVPAGVGSFTQSGSSTNTVGTLTIVAAGSGASGSYALLGGTLNATNLNVNQGGTFDQSGGTTTVSGDTTNAGTMAILANTFTTLDNFTNTGSLTIAARLTIGDGTLSHPGAFVQSIGSTLLDHGIIDPATVTITGGSFGGTGTVVGNVSVSGATLNAGGPAPGELHIVGNFSQTSGTIDLLVGPNSAGGFLTSDLLFDPGSSVSVTGTDIVFDFATGADPLAFLASNEINLDAFFLESDGSAFSSDVSLQSAFEGDTFQYEIGSGPLVGLSFDATTGEISVPASSNVPEPSTGLLLLTGLGLFRARKTARQRATWGDRNGFPALSNSYRGID